MNEAPTALIRAPVPNKRKLLTKAGEVALNIPRLRTLPFETQIIKRYQTRLERWPNWRYISGPNPRAAHGALDGMIRPKSDPIWHRVYPPWDFNCDCDVEDSDGDVTDPPAFHIEQPESGFAFDPAQAFAFSASDIADTETRAIVEEQIKQRFSGERDMRLWSKGKDAADDAPKFDAKMSENALRETAMILPETKIVVLSGASPEPLNRVNRTLDQLNRKYGFRNDLKTLAIVDMDPAVPGSTVVAEGRLTLNARHLKRSDWADKFPVANGKRMGLNAAIYEGREIESVVTHEVAHLLDKRLFGDGMAKLTMEMKARRKLLVDTFREAKRRGDTLKISRQADSDPFEFFSEIFSGKEVANVKYPDYIGNMMQEVLK